MVLALKDPNIYEILTFARRLMTMQDPSFDDIVGMDKRQYKMKDPTWGRDDIMAACQYGQFDRQSQKPPGDCSEYNCWSGRDSADYRGHEDGAVN